jgi:phosphoglycerate dehydrogenase-like enzyme
MYEPIEVLIAQPFPERLITRLRKISPRLHITVQKASNYEDIAPEIWERTQILYTGIVLPPSDKVAPNLKWIQFHWAGIDHILNSPLLQKPGIAITTLSGSNASQVAEHILMMILAFGHHLPELMDYQRKAEWPEDRWKRFSPIEVRDSTVGIIGYGSIGRQLARLLQPFNANVLATKRDAMHPQDNDYIPDGQGDPEAEFVQRLYPGMALRSMLKECDFISVSVPKTTQTLNLLSAPEFEVIKPRAFIIDVSRGGVIDHEVLIEALKERKIAGAALDVFPEEPLPVNSPLWKLPNVFITPHISGITSDYDQRAVEMFATNLQRFLAQAPLLNLFDLQRGY